MHGFHRLLALVSGLLIAPALAQAQADWPSKPVRIIVPSAAGGAADFVSRTFGRYLETQLKQPVLVENKPGANSIIGADLVAKAAPDGYTLGMVIAAYSVNATLYAGKLPYDTQKDLVPVSLVGVSPLIMVAGNAFPVKNIPELLAYARANPGKVTFGYYSSSSQVPSELLKARANIDMTGASYKNITQIVTDLAGGVVDFAFMDMLSAAPALQSGRMTPIAVTAPKRLASMPAVPAVAEAIPGYEVEGWSGLTAPAGTPRAVVERMSALVAGAIADPTVKAALEKQGLVPKGMGADEMKAFMAADQKRWAEWVRLAKIPPQ